MTPFDAPQPAGLTEAGARLRIPRRTPPGPLRVVIVGGGASGVLLAAQLMRKGAGRVAVSLVEKGQLLGCGVAYATRDPSHLLNTRVANMSAFPQLPDHFLDWLRARDPEAADPQGFVSRATYGRYMQELLEPWLGVGAGEAGTLGCWRDECVAIEPGARGVVARLAGGGRIDADLAVLATGHALPAPDADPHLTQPWEAGPPRADAVVLLVGSGLTMVDQTLSLLAHGHGGPITAVSRRGLLPQVHAPTDALCWPAAAVPIGAGPATLMRWLRAQARAREAAGGTWRDAVDGLRPHLQAIWRAWTPAARRRFLRHASAHWEVHRHRMPPASRARLAQAEAAGRLRLLRARFEGAERDPSGRLAAQLTRPDGSGLTLPVDHVVDCRGVRRDPEAHATPLVAGLVASGQARVDALRLGLDVGFDGAVLDRDGRASGRLFAIGPASRAAFWEVTAIPDIRAQAARLADRLLDGR